MRNQIWVLFIDLKFKGYYLSLLVDKYQKWERNTNIFLALVSSGSIAAWAIWNDIPLIWGAIIAVSQVLTVVKPYFPYYKYVKELNDKSYRVNNLSIELERLWYKLQHKKISDDDSDELYFEYKKAITEILKFGDDTIFNEKKEIESKANERMKVFLKNNYDIVIDTNQKI